VLVTHADGRQTVEEIKDDLGLKADDKAGMMRALRAQGVDAGDIDVYNGLDIVGTAALNPNEKPEQQYTHRKLAKAQASSFSIGDGSDTKSFKDVTQTESAGTSVSYKNVVNRHTGKKQVNYSHNHSSITFGDDGVNEKKEGLKKLHVSVYMYGSLKSILNLYIDLGWNSKSTHDVPVCTWWGWWRRSGGKYIIILFVMSCLC
jgi:hypothetical protein